MNQWATFGGTRKEFSRLGARNTDRDSAELHLFVFVVSAVDVGQGAEIRWENRIHPQQSLVFPAHQEVVFDDVIILCRNLTHGSDVWEQNIFN